MRKTNFHWIWRCRQEPPLLVLYMRLYNFEIVMQILFILQQANFPLFLLVFMWGWEEHRCKKGWNAGTMFPEIFWAGRNIQEDFEVFIKLWKVSSRSQKLSAPMERRVKRAQTEERGPSRRQWKFRLLLLFGDIAVFSHGYKICWDKISVEAKYLFYMSGSVLWTMMMIPRRQEMSTVQLAIR